jgi:hypothetical protein
MNTRTLEWIDAGREPQCPPDPRFPHGVVGDLRKDPFLPHCRVDLKYPARGVGHWLISCTCGYSAIVTAAGRPDDPRLALIPCKAPAHGGRVHTGESGRVYTETSEYPLGDEVCRYPGRETEGESD